MREFCCVQYRFCIVLLLEKLPPMLPAESSDAKSTNRSRKKKNDTQHLTKLIFHKNTFCRTFSDHWNNWNQLL